MNPAFGEASLSCDGHHYLLRCDFETLVAIEADFNMGIFELVKTRLEATHITDVGRLLGHLLDKDALAGVPEGPQDAGTLLLCAGVSNALTAISSCLTRTFNPEGAPKPASGESQADGAPGKRR